MSTAEVQTINRPRTLGRRLVALCLFAPTLALLLVAAWLHPDAHGHGTHTQLGLPPCGLKDRTGIPCPSCGMTTAFAHAAHGEIWGAFTTQPAGATLAILTAMTTLLSGYVLLTGAAVERYLHWLWRPAILWGLIGLFAAGWLYRLIVDFGDYT